jgi:hypothetical protein
MCVRRWLPRATLWYPGLCLGVPLQVSYLDSCLNIEMCVPRWLPRTTLWYSGLCLGVPVQVSYLDSCLNIEMCVQRWLQRATLWYSGSGSPTSSKLSEAESKEKHDVWTLCQSCLRTDVRKNIRIFKICLKSTRNYSELCKWRKMQQIPNSASKPTLRSS